MKHFTSLRLSAFFAGFALIQAPIVSAQTSTDNAAADTASGAAVRSANGGYGKPDNSAAALAQKRRVNDLVAQYNNCRSSARQLSKNKADKQAYRANCVRTYQPKFQKACVGAAMTIAICTKLKNQGKID
jgi:hypothetical protein